MAQLIATCNSGGSSGLFTTGQADWATARNAASATAENTTQHDIAARNDWGITRGTSPFDLSSLPVKLNVSSATYKFTYSDLGGGISNPDSCDVDLVLMSSMGDTTNAAVGDYNKFGTTVAGSIAFSSVAEGALANSIALDATGLGWIESAAGGWLLLGTRNSRDTDNASPSGVNRIDSLTATSPQLTINYTPIASRVIII